MTDVDTFTIFQKRVQRGVEDYLAKVFSRCPPTEVARIADYVTLNGGHRWRPMVVIASGQIFDDTSETKVMPAACGVEIAHAATILLDDLPSMDNALIRRGKPCAHLVFPAWAVDMAAAFLVNLAYTAILDNPLISAERRVAAALELSRTAQSLDEGQEKDVTQPPEHEEWEDVLTCYRLKTGSLYAASAKIGGILCGADAGEIDVLGRYGMKIGLSVQCYDDILDVVARAEETGKYPGNDMGKKTCVDFFGVKGAKELGDQFVEEALLELEQLNSRADLLRNLARQITWVPAFQEMPPY